MRITTKHLEALATELNDLTSNPLTPYTRVEGRSIVNVGNYHISYAYGGADLYQMSNEGGGIDDVLRGGHVSKRALYHRISAFIAGIRLGREL